MVYADLDLSERLHLKNKVIKTDSTCWFPLQHPIRPLFYHNKIDSTLGLMQGLCRPNPFAKNF